MRRFSLLAVALVVVADAGLAGSAAGMPTDGPQAASAAARHHQRKPLCRKHRVPIKKGHGYRCVAVRLPRVRGLSELLGVLSAFEPQVKGMPQRSPTLIAVVKESDAVALTALTHALGQVAALEKKAGTRADAGRTGSSGPVPNAGYDTGTQPVPGHPGWAKRESGSVTYTPGDRVGATRTTKVDVYTPDVRDARLVTAKVDLSRCPNADGRVTGTASLTLEHGTFEQVGSNTLIWVRATEVIEARVTAPVSDAAHIQPYDLKGTMRASYFNDVYGGVLGVSFGPSWPGFPTKRTHRMGFLDLHIPVGQTTARYVPPSPIYEAPYLYEKSVLLLGELYKVVGPRLRIIESGWRERKDCVKVAATPSSLKAAPGKSATVSIKALADGRPIRSGLDAHATGGTIRPAHATTSPGSVARFTFARTSKSAAQVTFTATSRHGIGETIVAVGGGSWPETLTGTASHTEVLDGGPGNHYEVHATAQMVLRLKMASSRSADYTVQSGTIQQSLSRQYDPGDCANSDSFSGSGTLDSESTLNWWSSGEFHLNLSGGTATETHTNCVDPPFSDDAPLGFIIEYYPPAGASTSLSSLKGSRTETRHDSESTTTTVTDTWDFTGP